jgi:hypothetical protein
VEEEKVHFCCRGCFPFQCVFTFSIQASNSQNLTASLRSRVNRFGELSPIGRLFTIYFGVLFKKYWSSPYFLLLFSMVKVEYLLWPKMGWATI